MRNIIFILLLLPFYAFPQMTDNFSDGDFINNPTWIGDTAKFKINTSKQLQLNSTGTDTSYLSTNSASINNTEWDFWVKLSFNTSANNNARVYIVSDQANTIGSVNGYFIQVGEANDSISLCKQSGTTITKIIHGIYAYTNHTTNTLRIKVKRDNIGNWSLFSDTLGGNNFLLEGNGFDNTFTFSSYLGVWCKYTSSNSTKFYFDDFYAGPIIIDTTPPIIRSIAVISATQLDINFSENVNTTTAELITNYFVNKGIGNPLSAAKDGIQDSLVHLTFSTSFITGTIYTITTNNVQDVSNNTMLPDIHTFALYTPKAYDVMINEIMADPDPVEGLPDYEYAELYNRTPYELNLKNWTLTIGSYNKVFPSVTIKPDSFLILCSSTAEPYFAAYGQVQSFSILSITNTGETFVLSDSSGHVIHTVSFTDSWYQDANKANGGWSLEQIDPSNPCGEAGNWIASVDPSGGTPGKRNSMYFSNPDHNPPQLSNVSVISSTSIQLNFNESLDSSTLSNPAAYSINKGIGIPSSVILVKPDYKKVILNLSSVLQHDTLYTCTVIDTIRDCSGNTAVACSGVFVQYDAKAFDVEINEIMADPDPPVGLPNYEFVELLNRTNFPINMNGWAFQMGSTIDTIPDATINPHGYLILTSSSGEVSLSNFGETVSINSFSITNAGENLTLYDSHNHVISTITFTDDWYQDTYKKNGGWSLEQIDPNNPCGGFGNWRASNNITGGTPGQINSINASNPDHSAPQLVRVSLISNNSIQLYFSEAMDSLFLKNISNYSIDNSIGHPVTVSLMAPDYSSVILNFMPSIQAGIVYTITVTDTLKDCTGNILPVNSSARFAIPQIPVVNDVVINEVLSNPKDNGVDYVELYNRSDKVIDLKQMVLASYDTIASTLNDEHDISIGGYLLFPQEYVVLTTNTTMVKNQYETPNPNWFAQMVSMPMFDNDHGIVVIALKNGVIIIDKLVYTADMYFPLLISTAGVSIERINYNRPSDDKTNWHSAAENVGFGTPTNKNSQYSEGVSSDDPISLSPEIFSPDNDGHDDVLNINYKFDVAGYVGNIVIYDASGRLIRNLVKGELLGTSGSFSWNGITNDNEKARIGMYVVYVEVFDLKGKTKHYKKSTVLASKL
jgi:hypothetical protein